MEQNDSTHFQQIEHYLQKLLQISGQLQSYQILQGGSSGATTYRLQLAGEELILKVAHMEGKQRVRERAQRELSCYQTLLPHLPLHTPQVVAYSRDTQAIALLLKAYEPTPSPTQWQQWHYLEVAEQLGHLHASFWQNTEQLARFPWLRNHAEMLTTNQVQHAEHRWQRLSDNPRFQAQIPQSRFQQLTSLFPLLEKKENLLASYPLTICHGDCHADNLLRDKQGQPIWADWQEVGIGPGPADLSFFMQRAFQVGGTVPFEAMIATYHQRLEAETKKQIPLTLLQQLLDTLELRSWLLAWPGYLANVSPQWLALLFDRINLLANRLRSQ